jgi:hypothetical protein
MNFLKFIVIITFWFSANAGNPVLSMAKADFKKANDYYAKTPNLSMDTYYMVFSEHDSQSLLEGKSGKYIKYGNNLYTKIDDIETLNINDKIISINQENKLISVGDNRIVEVNPILTNVDSILTMCNDIKMVSINANEKKYEFYFNDSDGSEFSRIDIQIDTKNSRYTKVVLFYQMSINLKADFYAEEKQPRLEVQYKNFKILTAEPLLFDQSLYLVNDNGKLKPAPKYYNYKVSDLRNQTRIKKAK